MRIPQCRLVGEPRDARESGYMADEEGGYDELLMDWWESHCENPSSCRRRRMWFKKLSAKAEPVDKNLISILPKIIFMSSKSC